MGVHSPPGPPRQRPHAARGSTFTTLVFLYGVLTSLRMPRRGQLAAPVNAHSPAAARACSRARNARELDVAVGEGEEGVVPAHPHVLARVELGAPLHLAAFGVWADHCEG